MKKNVVFSLIAMFALTLVFSSCETIDPVEYNDDLMVFYSELDDQIAIFEGALWDSEYTLSDLEEEYQKTRDIYDEHYDDLKALKSMKEDAGFYQSVVNFYDGIDDALANEYKEIMDMFSADEWLDEYNDKIYELDDEVLDKLIALEEEVVNAQEKFAATNYIDLY